MPKRRVRRGPILGAVFDTDGVITRTAAVHRAAWKRLFDAFLDEADPTQRPFGDQDYLDHVDGRARIDGVAGFLASRGLDLPLGHPTDAPGSGTVWALGNRKNGFFRAEIGEHGVERFDTTIDLVDRLRALGVVVAAVSASENQRAVLDAAGVTGRFAVRVDGLIARGLGLPGKPAPDLFLEAARRLGTESARTAVFEDAVAGVAAGRAGGFSPVIGIDRTGRPEPLRRAGADAVVADLAEISVEAGPDGAMILTGESDPSGGWRTDRRSASPEASADGRPGSRTDDPEGT